MSKSNRMTASDIRAAFRLVGECRELGTEFGDWREHFQRRLVRTAGADVGLGAVAGGATEDGVVAVQKMVGVDWPSEAAASAWMEFNRAQGHNHDPVVRQLAAAGLTRGVWTRRQAVEDSDWYASDAYERLCRPYGLDDCLMSVAKLPGGGLDWLVLFRPAGSSTFPSRSRRLVRAYHREIARLFGGSLAGPSEPSPSGLTSRQRETLNLLLDGACDKHVARRLGVRPATAHQYVLAVFRHFDVHSRGELAAYFLSRDRRPPTPETTT